MKQVTKFHKPDVAVLLDPLMEALGRKAVQISDNSRTLVHGSIIVQRHEDEVLLSLHQFVMRRLECEQNFIKYMEAAELSSETSEFKYLSWDSLKKQQRSQMRFKVAIELKRQLECELEWLILCLQNRCTTCGGFASDPFAQSSKDHCNPPEHCDTQPMFHPTVSFAALHFPEKSIPELATKSFPYPQVHQLSVLLAIFEHGSLLKFCSLGAASVSSSNMSL
jgi:hypothetical protein